MRITTITVSAQRKAPHPAVDYANLSGLVSLTAEIGEDENPAACAAKLQVQADKLVDAYMARKAEELQPKPRELKMQAKTADMAASLAEKHGAAK